MTTSTLQPPPQDVGHAVDTPGTAPLPPHNSKTIPVLDGWRAFSILAVLATHMLPLGPGGWGNQFLGQMGMSIFFTLSGFLITCSLLERLNIRSFFVRRACRILPLAFLYATLALLIQGKPFAYYLAHWTFITNYDYQYVTPITSHFWSLCVEVHFYICIGLLVLLLGRRAFSLLPVLCVGVTALRVFEGAELGFRTHLRVDEILAGACLALVYHNHLGLGIRTVLTKTWPAAILLLLAISAYPGAGPVRYIRPYVGAALVGATLFQPPGRLQRVLASRPLAYIATISYALYVVHKMTMFGWLGTGSGLQKYLIKRPLSFALTFTAAHASTFYYERWWIDLGKRITRKRTNSEPALPAAAAGNV